MREAAVDLFIARCRQGDSVVGEISVSEVSDPSAPLAPANDQVLYVGVNPASAKTEADALRSFQTRTEVIAPLRGDAVPHAGRSFDLASDEGRKDFVTSVGLRGAVAENVANVVRGLDALDPSFIKPSWSTHGA